MTSGQPHLVSKATYSRTRYNCSYFQALHDFDLDLRGQATTSHAAVTKQKDDLGTSDGLSTPADHWTTSTMAAADDDATAAAAECATMECTATAADGGTAAARSDANDDDDAAEWSAMLLADALAVDERAAHGTVLLFATDTECAATTFNICASSTAAASSTIIFGFDLF